MSRYFFAKDVAGRPATGHFRETIETNSLSNEVSRNVQVYFLVLILYVNQKHHWRKDLSVEKWQYQGRQYRQDEQ